MRLPFDGERESIPEEVVIDLETGLAINIPLAWQGIVMPGAYERILRLRREMGIEVIEPPEDTSPRIVVRSSGRRTVRRHPRNEDA